MYSAARSHFDITRSPATYATGYVRLTAAAGVGPYFVGPATLVVSDGVRLFRSTNTAQVTVPAGGSVDIPVRAEGAGSLYNAPSLTALVSPALAGVTVSSPAWGSGATWRTADGRDEETDADLRVRCRARWATLGRGATIEAYRYLATTCPDAPGVTRAGVVPGPGDGTVAIYLATTSGPASAGEATAVAAWLVPRSPATDRVSVAPATAVPVVITATITTRDTSDANRARVVDALMALQRALALGQLVDLGVLYAACYAATDVVDVDLSSPTADTPVATSAIAVLSWTITLVAP
jgi:phage-related baseplate assembly protein